MGSFNTACFFSHMPITPGDKVKLIFAVEGNESIACYPSDFWNPLTLPIDATYEDYNDYSIVPGQRNTEILLDTLREKVLPREQGENQYHEQAVDPKSLNEKNIFELLHDERLQMKGYFGDVRGICVIAVHTKVWNKILQTPLESWRSEPDITSETIDDWEAKRWQSYLDAVKLDKDMKADTGKFSGFAFFQLKDALKVHNNPFINVYDMSKTNDYSLEELEEIRVEVRQFNFVEAWMMWMNLTWQPQVLGGQETSLNNHVRFYTSILEVVQESKKQHDIEYAEYWGEDEDCEEEDA